MMATVLVAGSQVTTGWKWLAVLIALAAIGGFLIVVGISVTKPPWEWIQDPNGTSSTSKFQWLLFLVAVLFAYVALWIVRAKQGNYSAVPDVPDNILIVLGFSTATMATSKGIKVASVNATKRAAEAEALAAGSAPTVAKTAGVAAATALAPPAGVGGIFVDDEGFPDLSKIQLVAFTLVTLGIFIATVIHQIASNPPVTSLPDIDGTLMVLMGISSGGYLAKKTVADLAPRP